MFCGIGKKNTGRRLAPHTIYTIYDNYKKGHFKQPLDDPLVSEEDKRKIADLLKKPWNPYIRRHTAATEISKALKDSVLIDQYMGWSHAGNTRQKYQHYYNDDSFDAMLTIMNGLAPTTVSQAHSKKGLLRPKLCSNCSESNKPESKFCAKCKFVLSFEAFNEVTKEADERTKEIELMKVKLELLEKEKEASNQSKQELERKMTAIVKNVEQVMELFRTRAMMKRKKQEQHSNNSSEKPL